MQATAQVAALRDVDSMRRAVRVSALPLYLVRLSDADVLEVSDPALELGRRSRSELHDLTLMQLSAQPEHLRHSFDLLASGGLEACTRRGVLLRGDGTSAPLTVHYRAEARPAPREYVVGVVLDAEVTDDGTVLPCETPQDPQAPEQRVSALEEHLRRIADEVRLAGVATWPAALPTVDELPELALLTVREHEILARLHLGDRVRSIAEDLFLSESTVRNHLTAVFRKLGVNSQAALLARLRRRPAP